MSSYKTSIPPLHVNSEGPTEEDCIRIQQEWTPQVRLTLRNLNSSLARSRAIDLSEEGLASIIASSVPFDGNDFWTTEALRSEAKELLRRLPDPTLEVVVCVLSDHIKPRFIDTPHPKVSTSSGRRLPEIRKGPAAVLNSYESEQQKWKTHPGTAKLLIWCIAHLEPEDYEKVWHLVIPPTMSLLDDYQSYFRLQGVDVVSQLLQRVPAEHLNRTGVDGLFISSLRRNMVHLHTPLTPTLLYESVRVLVEVIDRTTAPNSPARFDHLCGLLGDGIIGSVWAFASQEQETIQSSLVGLSGVLRALGIGTVRYLKALVPQIVHNLNPLDPQHTSMSLQISSLQVLEVIIEVCRPRIYPWRGHILDGLGRCWVSTAEQPNTEHRSQLRELRSALRRVAVALSTACPSVIEDEYKTILSCDESMFRDLLSPQVGAG